MSVIGAIVGRALIPLAFAASVIAVAPAPANAAANPPDVTEGNTAGPHRADISCNITRGAHTGGTFCSDGWTWRDFPWPDGRKETFIVGWDYAVWHTWQRYNGDTEWSNWISLGGRANAGVWLLGYRDTPAIRILGTDNNFYCRYWGRLRGWDRWYPCTP